MSQQLPIADHAVTFINAMMLWTYANVDSLFSFVHSIHQLYSQWMIIIGYTLKSTQLLTWIYLIMGCNMCMNQHSQESNFDKVDLTILGQTRTTSLLLTDLDGNSSRFSNIQKYGPLNNSGYRIQLSSDNNLILVADSEQDCSQLIKYYLIYSFYARKLMQNSPKFNEAVEDFINLAERMQNESTELEMFKAEISKAANDAEAQQIMLNAYFEKSFIRECLNFVLMMSNDPKDIGYLRLLISTLHAAISAQYNQRKKKEALAIIYIVANVTNQDKQVLKETAQREGNITFPVFMRGFTSNKFAQQKLNLLKSSGGNWCIFEVMLSTNHANLDQAYDFGYYLYDGKSKEEMKNNGDVVFNIFNFYKVDKCSKEGNYVLKYGSLAESIRNKSKHDQRVAYSETLAKVCTMCMSAAKYYLKSQSSLFRLMHNLSDSQRSSQLSLRLSQSRGSTGQLDLNEINDHIELCIEENNLQEALKLSQINADPLMRAKQLQVHFFKRDYAKVDELITQMTKQITQKTWQAYEIVEMISIRRNMMKKKWKQARSELDKLVQQMMKYYGQDFEFMSREIIMMKAECEKKSIDSTNQTGSFWDRYMSSINLRWIASLDQ